MTSSFWSNQVALLLAAAYLNLAVPVLTGNGCCGEKDLKYCGLWCLLVPCTRRSATRGEASVPLGHRYCHLLAARSPCNDLLTLRRIADGKQIAAALLGFLLVGVISGFVLISVVRRTRSRLGRVLIVAGYTLAAPFGYFFGIIGPLTLEAFGEEQLPSSLNYFLLIPLTIGLYGSLPPICAVLIGLLTARIRERST